MLIHKNLSYSAYRTQLFTKRVLFSVSAHRPAAKYASQQIWSSFSSASSNKPTQEKMIIVHHLNNSRSQRVLWLLEELAMPYEIKHYQRDAETMLAPPELKAIHPLGKSPVISDGDIVVAESGAIVEYILDKYESERNNGQTTNTETSAEGVVVEGLNKETSSSPGLRPPVGTAERRQFTYWLHFSEGSAMPPLVFKLVLDRIRSAPMPFFVRPIARRIADAVMDKFVGPNIENNLNFIEQELSQHEWFVGNQFSAADIQMSFPLEAAAQRTDSQSTRPHLTAFVKKIQERPAYQRALEKGGPYSFAS